MSIWDTLVSAGRTGIFGPVGATIATVADLLSPRQAVSPSGFPQFKALESGTRARITGGSALAMTPSERSRREAARRQFGLSVTTPSGFNIGGAIQTFPRGVRNGLMGFPRRRRMNPGNFRALRRSLRRLESFEKAARRVGRFVAPQRRFKFKTKRRR